MEPDKGEKEDCKPLKTEAEEGQELLTGKCAEVSTGEKLVGLPTSLALGGHYE